MHIMTILKWSLCGLLLGSVSFSADLLRADVFAADDQEDYVVYEQKMTIDVLANDTCDEGEIDFESVVIVTQPAHGSVEVFAGFVEYTPNESYWGSDYFEYTVCDDNMVESEKAGVMIEVLEPNHATVSQVEASTLFGTPVEVDLLNNTASGDFPLDLSSYRITQQPLEGVVTIDENCMAKYTPGPNTTGTFAFSYTVDDIEGFSAVPAQVSVTVEANSAPTISVDGSLFEGSIWTVWGHVDDDQSPGSLTITFGGIVDYMITAITDSQGNFSRQIELDAGIVGDIIAAVTDAAGASSSNSFNVSY